MKLALADPVKREFYETVSKEKDIPAFPLAVGDYLGGLSIDLLDLDSYHGKVGDLIVICAVDNVGVVDVDVEHTSINGTNIEKGKAMEVGARSGNWMCTATILWHGDRMSSSRWSASIAPRIKHSTAIIRLSDRTKSIALIVPIGDRQQ